MKRSLYNVYNPSKESAYERILKYMRENGDPTVSKDELMKGLNLDKKFIEEAFRSLTVYGSEYIQQYNDEEYFITVGGISWLNSLETHKLRKEQTKFNKMLNDYYTARGWDVKKGIPMRATLRGLGLKKVADELEKRGKIKKTP